MSAVLVVTIGLPGSGKTTRAVDWVAESPAIRARVNRDQLRIMLHGGRLGTYEQECMVTDMQRAGVRALLRSGIDVVADDTNLSEGAVERWRALAVEEGAGLLIWDFMRIPIEECIRRDALREGVARVGEVVIRDMHSRYMARQAASIPSPNTAEVDRG